MIRCRYALILKTLFLVTFILLYHSSAGADTKAPESISLEFANRPLSYVLDQLSQTTGLRFIYDRDWADASISVKIIDQDLDKALRKVLKDYNYAILYGPDGNVRIMIYGEKSDSSSSPASASSPVDYVHVGSAAIQEEDAATRQDIEETQEENDSADTAADDRDEDLGENEKKTDDANAETDDANAETDGESKETETGEMDEAASEEDIQNPVTAETID